MPRFKPILIVQGGADNVYEQDIPAAQRGLKAALQRGYEALIRTGSAVDAVEQAVNTFETDGTFNAGYGAVLTTEGNVEMDASIMNGATLDAGCVSQARDIVHPVSLARCIMEKTQHLYMAGEGAMKIAEKEGFDILPKDALITAGRRKSLDDFKAGKRGRSGFYTPTGTVGAVAIDAYGNLAAATSTGGFTGKLPGRIGDATTLGGGTYADNETAAISTTGHGETSVRYGSAGRITALIRHKNLPIQQAIEQVINEMTERFKSRTGIIAIDYRGEIGIYFNTKQLSWAYRRDGEVHYGINPGEHFIERVDES